MESSVIAPSGDLSARPLPFIGAAWDTLAIARRNLIGLWRVKQFLVFTMIQPMIFVVLFRYVFGGAIATPFGIPYVDYLMPGIFVQTVTFGAITTGVSMATDVKSGLLERFRSLPMARSAVLSGRTVSDIARTAVALMLITGVGFAVGFRVKTNTLAFMGGLLLVLLFAYALLWVFTTVGLAVGDPESAQAASFPVIAPRVFASSAFVPVSTMPSWLQGFAKYQPVSVAIDATRSLMLGGPYAAPGKVVASIAYSIGIVAVFAPLAVIRYRKAA
jgi:ABC transporter DrrB family efflux protein